MKGSGVTFYICRVIAFTAILFWWGTVGIIFKLLVVVFLGIPVMSLGYRPEKGLGQLH